MVSNFRRNACAFCGSCATAFVVAMAVLVTSLGGANASDPAKDAAIDTTSVAATSTTAIAAVGTTSVRATSTTVDVSRPVAAPTSVVAAVQRDRLDSKTPCVYARHDVRSMTRFGQQVGRNFDCALVYNNAAPGWKDWAKPWFVVHGDPNFNWASWANAQPGRTLIVSQSLIPKSAPSNWRQRGVAGEYDTHIRMLGASLVDAGLGTALMRVAFEANGPWMIDALGKTASDRDAWRMYWRRFVTVMRSVPGAKFEFDWTVNAGYQALALDSYYPGDDVVDIVGVDAYDSSVHHDSYRSAPQRWDRIAGQPGGLLEVLAFAKLHRKPLSIPEWGIAAPGAPMYGAGDNATYIDGIAAIVRSNRRGFSQRGQPR